MLANKTRLRLFAKLTHQQPQSVSQLAESLALTLPVASQSLRALEARSLLKVNRVHRRVEYRIPTGAQAGPLAELIAALQPALLRDPHQTELVFKLATAFTHPARIEIYRELQRGPLAAAPLQARLRLSWPALLRHLAKLTRRGYVEFNENDGRYALTPHRHPLGRVLAGLALTQAV